jgi:uncharacterized membrane protein YkgB
VNTYKNLARKHAAQQTLANLPWHKKAAAYTMAGLIVASALAVLVALAALLTLLAWNVGVVAVAAALGLTVGKISFWAALGLNVVLGIIQQTIHPKSRK